MSAPSTVKARATTPKPAAPARALPYAAVLALLPLLVLWRQDDALYTPLWQSDPWFYLGYFRDLVNFKRDLFEGFYYGSRLSWVLPGFAVHRLLPPLAANAVLHLAVQTVCVLALFATLRRTVGERAAFLSATIFGLHPWLWAATGWDHVNGAAIAYYLVGMALVTRAAEKPGRGLTLLAAGASIAGAVWAHLYLAAFAPFLVLHYLVLTWARQGTSIIRALGTFCLWAGSGFVLFTAPLCVINGLWIDGNFWFWTPSLRTAQAVTSNYVWTESLWYQGRLAPYLIGTAAAAIAALALLPGAWKQAREQRNPVALLFAMELLGALALMVLLQSRGITLLGHYYYACYLLPATFLVIGASFWPAIATTEARTWRITCCATLFVFGLLWVSPSSNPVLLALLPGWLAFLLAALVLAAALYMRRTHTGAWLAVGGFAMLTSMIYNGSLREVSIHGTRQEFMRVINNRRIIEQDRRGQPTRFWYDRDEPAFHEYFALNASYMAEFARIGEHFPNDCSDKVELGDLAVVTSGKEHTPELAQRALAACWQNAGVKPAIQTVQPVARPDQPYTLVVLKAVDDLAQRRPVRVTFDSKGRGILELVPIPKEPLSLPLDRWVPFGGGSLQRVDGEMIARTPVGATSYGLTYAPLVVPETATYRFELKYRHIEGQIAFGVLPADESGWLSTDLFGRAIPEGRLMRFTVPLRAGEIVLPRIANSNPRAVSSTFVILDTSITALAPRQ